MKQWAEGLASRAGILATALVAGRSNNLTSRRGSCLGRDCRKVSRETFFSLISPPLLISAMATLMELLVELVVEVQVVTLLENILRQTKIFTQKFTC